MDRSHLIKPSSNPPPSEGPRQVEIRELDKPLIEIRDGVVNLILALQVIYKKPSGDAPFENVAVQVKLDGEKISEIITDESGLLEKRLIIEPGKSAFTITIPGTVAVYRKKIAEVTTRDFDEEKRKIERDRRQKDEFRKAEEARRKEMARIVEENEKMWIESEAKGRFQQKLGNLYTLWFEFVVHRFMLTERKEYLRKAAKEIETRVHNSKMKLEREWKRTSVFHDFEKQEKEAHDQLQILYSDRSAIIKKLKSCCVDFGYHLVDREINCPQSYSSSLRERFKSRLEACDYRKQKSKDKGMEEFDRLCQKLEQNSFRINEICTLLDEIKLKLVSIRKELLKDCREVQLYCRSDQDVIEFYEKFLSDTSMILHEIDRQVGRVLDRICWFEDSRSAYHSQFRLDEAVKVWEEELMSNSAWYSLYKQAATTLFLTEFNEISNPLTAARIWTEAQVRIHLRKNPKCVYDSSKSVSDWSNFKKDITDYLGAPLEETDFYRANRKDFETIEETKELGMVF